MLYQHPSCSPGGAPQERPTTSKTWFDSRKLEGQVKPADAQMSVLFNSKLCVNHALETVMAIRDSKGISIGSASSFRLLAIHHKRRLIIS